MRAVCVREPGGVEVLEIREVPEPAAGPDELKVRVRAAGLNRADLLQRRGLYPAPPDAPADIPGLEFSGVIEAVGESVRGWRPGDRVMGIVSGGACAEKLVVHERAALRVPASLELPGAAAIPEAFVTAFDALFLQARLQPGERVLIHAVASGVGTAAVQLARLAGAFVLGSSRSAEKLPRCVPFGLDHGVHVTGAGFADQVLRATGGAGVDVVLDLVGGDYLPESLASMAVGGRLILVGLMGGAQAALPLATVLTRRLTVRGTVLRSRPLEEKLALVQAFARQVLPLFEAGRLRPVLDEVLAMEDVRRAHTRLEANATFGKVVLTW